MNTPKKDLEYCRKNAEENYPTTPISVLKYISEMEKELRILKMEKALRKTDVSMPSERLCFCGQKLEFKSGDNRVWRECNNGHKE